MGGFVNCRLRSLFARLLFFVVPLGGGSAAATDQTISKLLSTRNQTPRVESIPLQLALRKGTESCALQWESWDGTTRYCLPRHRWDLLVNSEEQMPIPRILSQRVRAPLLNELHSPISSVKQKFWVMELSGFPYVVPWPVEGGSHRIQSWVYSWIFQIEVLRERIARRLEPNDPFGLLRRILLDERPSRSSQVGNEASGLMEADFLRLSGWVHLLTASGIHLLAWISFLQFAYRKGIRSPRDSISYSLIHGLIWGIGLSGLLFYSLLVGGRAGLVRPVLALLVRQGLQAQGGKPRLGSVLLITLGVDELLGWVISGWGGAEWAMGRSHYGLAVAGGLWGWHRTETLRSKARSRGFLTRWKCHLISHAAMAISSWLWVVPLDLAHGSIISPWTPWVSLISIPLLAGILFPCLLVWAIGFSLGAEELASDGFEFCGILVQSFCQFLQSQIVDSGFAQVALPQGATFLVGLTALFSFLFGSLLFSPGMRRLNFALCWLFLALFFSKSYEWTAEKTELYQLDVGQGDSALLILDQAGKRSGYLIDGGADSALSAAQWKRIQAAAGIGFIQSVFLTHLDMDHVGGLRTLMQVIPVRCVVASRRHWESPRGVEWREEIEPWVEHIISLEEGISARQWNPGHSQCVPAQIQWAHLSGPSSQPEGPNSSMSAYVFHSPHGVQYINLGDSALSMEMVFQKWLERLPRPLGSYRIFKLSHHGSKTSTSAQLLEKLAPDEVWISAGVGNSFGHPSLEVLQTLKAPLRIRKIRRTDESGALHFRARAGKTPRI